MPITPSPICQACQRPIGRTPAIYGVAPDGRQTWWLHCDVRDCVRSLQTRAPAAPLLCGDGQRMRGA